MSRQFRHLSTILKVGVRLEAATQRMSTSPGEMGYCFEQNVVMFATCRIVCRGARQSRAESPAPAAQPSFAQVLDWAENEPKLRHLTCPVLKWERG
jgi:hypothetical protein